MTDNERNSMNWVVAVLASVIMHAGIVGLFILSGRPSVAAVDDAPVAEADAVSAVADGEPSAPREAEAPAPATAEAATPPAPAAATQVRTASASAAAPSAETRPSVPLGERVAEIPEFYTVKQGDTLTKIARSFGTTPEEVAKVNGKELRQMDRIWVGQKIRLRAR
ncbi:MAG: LysM peptidoglycan-binding domain-containing protein [Kiritimatiellae bacterium]|nr:LysM peptidoglycan-binding domain-containing protein [Kiritimatiellia bacterium]